MFIPNFLFLIGVGSCLNIPFESDCATSLIVVNGTIQDVDGLLDPIGPEKLHVQFDTQTWLEFQPLETGQDHNDVDVFGLVRLQSENGTFVDAYEDQLISLLDFLEGSVFSKGYIGIGQNGPFLNQWNSIAVLPSEKMLKLGISDFDFNATYCRPNSFFQSSFLSPIGDARISRKLAGRFHLLDLHTLVPIVFGVFETLQRMREDTFIQIIPERIFIPDILFRTIRSRVVGDTFENCTQVLELLPIIALDLMNLEGNSVGGTIHFYPSDYTFFETSQNDTCTLRLSPSSLYSSNSSILGFDPLLLRDTNIRITNAHMSFCDCAK